ncbi:hypothetical protein HY495_01800 [Candidatus Woesearchaeota archaeon]|nr:hypothetical protein [Candidatus Woesearchaeota archaeon]
MTTKIFQELQEIKRKAKIINQKIGSAKLSYPQVCRCRKEIDLIYDEILYSQGALLKNDPFAEIGRYGQESIYIFKTLRENHSPLSKKSIISKLKRFEIHPKRVEYCLELLRKTGEIYEPKKGFVQRI